MRKLDALVVGAGFSGAVIAERLADQGMQVLLIDKRPHIGGNAYYTIDRHGVRIHPYGPHIFHTNGMRIAEYLSAFTTWRPYEHRVLAKVGAQLLPIPININTVNRLYGLALDETTIQAFYETVREPRDAINNSEDVVVNGNAVDADALGHRLQVRRGETAGAQPDPGDQRIDHPGGRGLAVRPGHLDDRVGVLRIADQVHQRHHPGRGRRYLRLGSPAVQQVLHRGQRQRR